MKKWSFGKGKKAGAENIQESITASETPDSVSSADSSVQPEENIQGEGVTASVTPDNGSSADNGVQGEGTKKINLLKKKKPWSLKKKITASVTPDSGSPADSSVQPEENIQGDAVTASVTPDNGSPADNGVQGEGTKKINLLKKKKPWSLKKKITASETPDSGSPADSSVQPEENIQGEGVTASVTPDSGGPADGVQGEDTKKINLLKKKKPWSLKKKITASETPDSGGPADSSVQPEVNIQGDAVTASVTPDSGSPADNGVQGGDTKKINLLKKKKPWSLKKKIIVGSASVVSVIIICVAIVLWPFLIQVINKLFGIRSLYGFDTINENPSASTVTNSATQTSEGAPPTATLDEIGQFIAQGNYAIFKDPIVNILLIGVDYSPERNSWGGKHTYHSDVMIVLSINQTTNQVSLISLPRDTYAQIPADPKGIYKLNASLNCGGKWPETADAACQQVCKAASWMIGGLPIPYYYAVDMTAVKTLVDKIGGVDFNVDIAFTLDGRSYTEGMQHLDGQGALDYMRVRKPESMDDKDSEDETGDANRVNRQKNMLKAIFEKIKNNGGITQIANILSAVTSDDFVTNVPMDTTMGFAGYALLNINPDDVKVYSIGGSYRSIFGLDYTITNQANRINVLKAAYGFDITDKTQVAAFRQQIMPDYQVPDYSAYDWASAHNLWLKMQKRVTLNQSQKLLKKIKAKLDADAATPSPTDSPTTSVTGSGEESSSVKVSSAMTTDDRKYPADGAVWNLYNKCVTEYNQLDSNSASDTMLQNIQKDIATLAKYFKIKVTDSTWEVIYNPWYGKFNQSYVHNKIKVDPR